MPLFRRKGGHSSESSLEEGGKNGQTLKGYSGVPIFLNRTGEDNGDAHLKRHVMNREVVVAITEGRLDFGPWEQIFYGEFDGRRRKRVLVKIIGE